ncbi:MAG: hypothetical protein DRN30_05550 [Thermoplasmata archaeon]|nr:hypothetical protein [Euryarchaeota archaeon]RLF64373.1 MAG: hypothetical protein DRN30_05550 [Thermoplasmata archaeon]
MSGKTIAAIIVYALALLNLVIFLIPYTIIVYKIQRRRFLWGLRKGLKEAPKELRKSVLNAVKYYTSIRFLVRNISKITRGNEGLKWMRNLF